MPGFKNYQLTSTAFRVEFTFRNLTIIFTQPYFKNSVLDGQDGHVKGFYTRSQTKTKDTSKENGLWKKIEPKSAIFYCVRQIVTVVNDRILNKSSNLLVTLSIAIVPNETQINFL